MNIKIPNYAFEMLTPLPIRLEVSRTQMTKNTYCSHKLQSRPTSGTVSGSGAAHIKPLKVPTLDLRGPFQASEGTYHRSDGTTFA